MTKKINLLLLVLSLVGLSVIQSCKSDDPAPVANVLIAGNRTTGKFYTVDEKTGTTKEIFTPTYDGTTLNEVRAVVFHPKKNLYYISQNSYTLDNNTQLGYLYTLNPTTKVATRINQNNGVNGVVWDAIVNWAVAADDSLISVGDFNGDGNGVVKFGTDGVRSKKTVQASICCGLGLIYDSKTNKFIVSNDGGYKNKVVISDLDAATGALTNQRDVITFTGFPEDFSVSSNLSLKAMAQNGSTATVFGLLYNGISASRKTYFVKIDLTAKSMTYISTIGADINNQYNNLTYVPANKF